RRWTSPPISFLSQYPPAPQVLHSFPTRRSSDLGRLWRQASGDGRAADQPGNGLKVDRLGDIEQVEENDLRRLDFGHLVLFYLFEDRKSTRLNSSHRTISYAVFCLKKKKNNHYRF